MLGNDHVIITEEDLRGVRNALLDADIGGGSAHVDRYEAALAAFFGSDEAIACSSGTAAITIALQAVGVDGAGEVLLPATAPVMTPLAVRAAGATPVFVDVSPEVPFSPDLTDAAACLNERTAAIITVPMWGYAGREREVGAFARANDLSHIEDAAQAHGSTVGGSLVGTLGVVGAFSTHKRKLMTTGEGGFCLTRDPVLAARMRAYRAFGMGDSGYAEVPGQNAKLAGVLAALGTTQLRRLRERVDRRRSVWAAWREALDGLSALAVLGPHHDVELNAYAMVLVAETPGFRDRAEDVLRDAGLISDPGRYGYAPAYTRPALQDHARSCPVAEAFCSSVCTIPTHEAVPGALIVKAAAGLKRL